MVDKTLVLRKLSELEQYLEQVRTYAAVTVDAYTADWKTQRIVERTLQLMIELCLDVAAHIISDRRLRVPTSYADAFTALAEAGLISGELSSDMERMAKFRNILVHQYERIDAAIVITILQRHLDDFLLFRDAIIEAVREEVQI